MDSTPFYPAYLIEKNISWLCKQAHSCERLYMTSNRNAFTERNGLTRLSPVRYRQRRSHENNRNRQGGQEKLNPQSVIQ